MAHIVLEDLNYDWSKEEFFKILDYWHQGLSLDDISKKMNRDYDECGLLLIDISEITPSVVPVRSRGLNTSNPVEKCEKFNLKASKNFYENPERYEMFSRRHLNYFWDLKEVDCFVRLWKENKTAAEIAAYFKRKSLEIQLLIVDQCRLNRIKPRKIGIGVQAS